MGPEKSFLSDRAERDLSIQYKWYLEKADEDVAEQFLKAIVSSVSKIEEMPGLGRSRRFRDERLKNLRSRVAIRPFHSHLIFYRDKDGAIEVFRVLHGARDIPKMLLDAPEV